MRHVIRNLSLVAVASFVACDGASPPERDTKGSGPAAAVAPSSDLVPFFDRLSKLNQCNNAGSDPDVFDGTIRTFPPQTPQGEGPPLPPNTPVLYAFYLLDEDNLINPFTTPIPPGSGPTPPGFTSPPGTSSCATPVHATNGPGVGKGAFAMVQAVIEPKTGLVCDANDPRSFIDIFTDICGIEVINNESGWYEGWLEHFLRVPDQAHIVDETPQPFGTISTADLHIVQALGTGQNQPGAIFTIDGTQPHADLHPTGDPTAFTPQNRVPVVVSLGAYNGLQGHDAHSYWELNEYTNWTFPLYEMFSTGGRILDRQSPTGSFSVRDFYQNGFQYSPLGSGGPGLDNLPNADSRIPGSGPRGILNNNSLAGKVAFGDNPALPRDPDRTPEACDENDAQAEPRLRFIPSGLAQQILLDAFLRRDSFHPEEQDIVQRVYLAYAFEVSVFDTNNNGVIDFIEGDIDEHPELYLRPTDFEEIFVTREINDGLLAPRFFPTEQAYILKGPATFVNATCPSSGTDGSSSSSSSSSSGGACSVSLPVTSASFPAEGGTGTVTIDAPAGCAWESVSTESWIWSDQPVIGAGNGSQGFRVIENTGPARTGSIIIGGQTFSITQAGR